MCVPERGGADRRVPHARAETRTADDGGISASEIDRAFGGGELLDAAVRRHPEWCVLWAVVGDDVLDLQSGDARDALGPILTDISKEQRRHGIPQLSMHILEGTGGVHANVLFIGTKAMGQRLCRRHPRFFRRGFGKRKAIQPVRQQVQALLQRYLLKERTDEADEFAARARIWLEPRLVAGPFPLPGGGDRVKLSRQLKAEGIGAGLIDPWKGTNANRRAYRSRRS